MGAMMVVAVVFSPFLWLAVKTAPAILLARASVPLIVGLALYAYAELGGGFDYNPKGKSPWAGADFAAETLSALMATPFLFLPMLVFQGALFAATYLVF